MLEISVSWNILKKFWGSGKRGIRTPEALLTLTRFPGVPLQPLEHLSLLWNNLIISNELQNYKLSPNFAPFLPFFYIYFILILQILTFAPPFLSENLTFNSRNTMIASLKRPTFRQHPHHYYIYIATTSMKSHYILYILWDKKRSFHGDLLSLYQSSSS